MTIRLCVRMAEKFGTEDGVEPDMHGRAASHLQQALSQRRDKADTLKSDSSLKESVRPV
jgi:hypothetical protein